MDSTVDNPVPGTSGASQTLSQETSLEGVSSTDSANKDISIDDIDNSVEESSILSKYPFTLEDFNKRINENKEVMKNQSVDKIIQLNDALVKTISNYQDNGRLEEAFHYQKILQRNILWLIHLMKSQNISPKEINQAAKFETSRYINTNSNQIRQPNEQIKVTETQPQVVNSSQCGTMEQNIVDSSQAQIVYVPQSQIVNVQNQFPNFDQQTSNNLN